MTINYAQKHEKFITWLPDGLIGGFMDLAQKLDVKVREQEVK